jgi:hypothetical protein
MLHGDLQCVVFTMMVNMSHDNMVNDRFCRLQLSSAAVVLPLG